MKIGPKLALCFVAVTVIPLAVTSFIYARSSNELGRDMADTGKQVLTNRITEDLNRSTELSVQSLRRIKDELLDETVRNASEIARKLVVRPDEELVLGAQTRPFAVEAAEDLAKGINLTRGNVRFEIDADPAVAPNVLARLEGLGDVARTSYLRNRQVVRATNVVLEVGITAWYPGGSVIEDADLRESDWYLNTLEQLQPEWFEAASPKFRELYAVAPLITPHGDLAGVLRTIVPIEKLLNAAIPAASIPTNATAYLVVVPRDHPNLYPHRIAVQQAGDNNWKATGDIEPLDVEGDDAWLKVLSDIRSGVGGLEFVKRGEESEIWSFRPVISVEGGEIHLVVAQPRVVVSIAEAQAETVVERAFSSQIKNTSIVVVIAGLIAVGLAMWAARTLTNPIRDLHQGAARLAKGDFSVRVERTSGDEIGDLGDDFNTMVPALEEHLKVKRDLGVAREIQQYLVPKTPPKIEGFDIAGKTIYCDETGGDYLDFISASNGGTVAVIGDVTGHGVGAALLMAAARSSLRAHMRHLSDVGLLMEAVNRDLSADSSGGRFLTLFFVHVRPRTDTFTWLSAGHETALLFDPKTSVFTELTGDGIPLGVDATWRYRAEQTKVPSGAVLVSYTDGIREAKNAAGERFGVDRLKQSIKSAHARGSFAVSEKILEDWSAYCGDVDVTDDVSLMVIKATS